MKKLMSVPNNKPIMRVIILRRLMVTRTKKLKKMSRTKRRRSQLRPNHKKFILFQKAIYPPLSGTITFP